MCATKTLVFSLLLWSLAIGSTSCQERRGNSITESKSHRAAAGLTKPTGKSPDNWQRMKDCAEQADRMLKRNRLEEGATIGADYIVGESKNHYSSRYERCF